MGTNASTIGKDGRTSFDVNFARGKRLLSYNEPNLTPRPLVQRRGTIAVTGRSGTLPSIQSQSLSSAENEESKRGTLTTIDQPNARPPKSKKKEFLKNVNFSDIDFIATEAPLDILTKTMWDVVEYLVITPSGKIIDNMQKTRAIFRWMTSFDVYSIDAEIIPPTDSPLEHMLNIQCDLATHAQMFYMLCMLADIPCVIINGITKGGTYEVGGEIKYSELTSQWNAVHVNGQWRFLDVFWASTCVLGKHDINTVFVKTEDKIFRTGDEDDIVQFNDFYFFTDPDQFIHTHLPDEDEWQLLPVPIKLSDFEKMPYLREYFHLYEMKILEKRHKINKLNAEKETVNISFGLPIEKSKNYMFKFMLHQKRTQIESNKPVDVLLERFVAIIHLKDKITFKIRLPFYGKYHFDVYGCDFTKSTNFSLLCTYMIFCHDPKEHCLPFPDFPEVGFGNNPHAENTQVYSMSPTSPFVRTQNGVVEFMINADKGKEVTHALKSLFTDSGTLSRYIIARREENQYIVNMKLPKEGEYVVKFYINPTEKDPLYNLPTDLLNYVIKYKGEERPSNLPFPNVPDGLIGAKLDAVSLGVICLSNKNAYIKASEGRESFKFKAEKSISLICEISCCKREGNTRASIETEINEDIWDFHADMPVPGEYTVNVFAFQNKDKSKLYHVHSFFIYSDGNVTRRVHFFDDSYIENMITDSIVTSDDHIVIVIPPLYPDEKLFTTIRKIDEKYFDYENNTRIICHNDKIELFLSDFGEYILEVFTQDETEKSVTTTGRFSIHRKKESDIFEDDFDALVNSLKPQNEEEPVEEPIPDRNDSVFEPCQFDEIESEDSDSDNGEIPNTAETDDEDKHQADENDTIYTPGRDTQSITDDATSLAFTEKTANEDEDEDDSDKETREKIREIREKSIKCNMKNALKANNLKQMKTELRLFKEAGLDQEDKMIAYVKQVVNVLTAKEKLTKACKLRNPDRILKSIIQAKEANLNHRLDMQIVLSRKILNRVKEIERINKPLLKMNQNMLTEMKKYQTPPDGVHQVLKATFLLLGDDQKQLKSWKSCQSGLFKTGKEYILRRISHFDINSASPEVVKKIKTLLKPYSLVHIRDVSKGAATFYVWVTGILKEMENRQKNLHKTRSLRSALPRPAMMVGLDNNTVLRI